MPDLAILYEHPRWFLPLFAALDSRGVSYAAIDVADHRFDPAARDVPAPVVFNRVAMSSFLRGEDHPIFYAASLLARWQELGARVVNGPSALAYDTSKARQVALLADLGVAVPRTLAVHRAANVPAAAQAIGYPVLVKANIGGSGANIARFDDAATLAAAVADGTLPQSIDRVLLVQDYVPARGGITTRVETLGGRFLYAIDVSNSGGSFDLCLADICAAPGAPSMTAAAPPAAIVSAVERVATAMALDVGGVEYMVDDRDGVARVYDINALSNFVADPLPLLGYDPHERLVDYLVAVIAEQRS
ncbi:MAG TPA: alpha-L-glutamate ligase [Sphingomonadaceae bacterium]|nr:alpha-L-glutamate ligase [Sphingomonadaceae bacterium]